MQILISLAKPATYVELGVYRGCSLHAAMSAAKYANLHMQATAIDTWEGDIHSGEYDGRAFKRELSAQVAAYHPQPILMQRTFDAALGLFDAGSIDILHIDGLHTYEAVKNDFENWLPKLSESGIVLFHDTVVTTGSFGVHRLWAEIEDRFQTISFRHSHGLGVALVGPKVPWLMAKFYRQWTENAAFRGMISSLCEQAAYAYPDWFPPILMDRLGMQNA